MQHFKPAFKGCVVIPLTDDDDDLKRIKYYGDWANKRTHARIMRKPRRYQLTFYFKGFDGERGMEQIQILDKDNFWSCLLTSSLLAMKPSKRLGLTGLI